jgi:hypothetical protein
MTEEQIALARRVVACKGWRWMSGMLTGHGRLFERRGLLILQNGAPWVCVPDGQSAWFEPVAALPDLTDPATLGCLLALVRKAWRCPTVYVRQSTPRVRRRDRLGGLRPLPRCGGVPRAWGAS